MEGTEDWKPHRALGGTGNAQDTAEGGFQKCVGDKAEDLSYRIHGTVELTSSQRTSAQITTAVRGQMAGIGWKLQASAPGWCEATHGGVAVRIWEISQLGVSRNADALYVQSSCANYGKATGLLVNVTDGYPAGDAASSPIPTGFPTPTQ